MVNPCIQEKVEQRMTNKVHLFLWTNLKLFATSRVHTSFLVFVYIFGRFKNV